MELSQLGFRDLTAEEIGSVLGGWEFGEAAAYLLDDLNYFSLSGGPFDPEAGWNFENGGGGWGYWVNGATHEVSGLMNLDT